jgi:hypothetical protein
MAAEEQGSTESKEDSPLSLINKGEELVDGLELDKEQTEEESKSKTLSEKAQEKVSDTLKDKAKEKAKEVIGIGDEEEGKKELADRIIKADNERQARKATQSTLKTGVPTETVSTVTGQVPPSPASMMEAAGEAGRATASPAKTKMAARAGRGMAPEAERLTQKAARSTASILDDVMDVGRTVAREVIGGMKNSKNIRAAGLAALIGTSGYLTGKMKDGQTKQKAEFNRQQEIRRQLMGDG